MTPVQSKLLRFIIEYTDVRACSPSFDEMAAGIGLRSKSGVDRVLRALVRDGWIEYSGTRNITILKRPGAGDPYSFDALRGLSRRRFSALISDVNAVISERRATT
jgi:SOS-response transcriptional repressor LexA